jgi:hypothetical protein
MAPKKKIEMKQLPRENSNNVEKLIQGITNRYRVTAREARDIVTAVGTSASSLGNTFYKDNNPLKLTTTSKKNNAASAKNLVKQVKETAVAAVTGKKGTTSAKSGGMNRGYALTSKSKGPVYERDLKPGTSRDVKRKFSKGESIKKYLNK